MHGGDSEVGLLHLLSQNIDLATGVAENNGLRDAQGVVQVTKDIEFEFLLFNINVELLDTFQGEFVLLDENFDGVAHEIVGNIQNFTLERGRDEDDLDTGREQLENFVNLILETAGKHFIGFIENEHFEGGGPKGSTIDHVINTTGSTNNDVDTGLKNGHILTHIGSTNTGVTADS